MLILKRNGRFHRSVPLKSRIVPFLPSVLERNGDGERNDAGQEREITAPHPSPQIGNKV